MHLATLVAASVDYNLEHITTNDTHVTATHIYTTSQTLDFEVGQISKSFLVTIHDDRIYTGDKMFLLSLTNPTNGAMLGPSRRTTVTILDDDLQRTVPRMTNTVQSSSPLEYTKWLRSFGLTAALAQSTGVVALYISGPSHVILVGLSNAP